MSTIQTTAGGIPVLILKERTKESKGREAQRNNTAAARQVWPGTLCLRFIRHRFFTAFKLGLLRR